MIKGMPFHKLMESLKRKIIVVPGAGAELRLPIFRVGNNGKIYSAPLPKKERRSFFLARREK